VNSAINKLKKIGFHPVSQKSHSVIMKSPNGVAAVYSDGNYEGFIKQNNIDEIILNESSLRKILEMVLIVGLTTTYFTTDITVVSGVSMEPTYHNWEIIVKSKVPKDVNKLMVSRGSIIKFKSPSGETSLKRIVGIPGDTVEFRLGAVFINGKRAGGNPDWFRKKQADILNKAQNSGGVDILSKLNEPVTFKLKNDQYYVVGDNEEHSIDSRNYGPISPDSILSVIKK
jgi:signal peptidase I